MNTCFTPIKNSLLVLFLLTVLSGTHTAYAAAPTITSFSPLSGPVDTPQGTEVTITGTGFSTNESENAVFFGTIKVTPFLSSNTVLIVTVPKGFAYERITVEVNNLSVTSNQYFLVTSSYNCPLTQYSFQNNADFVAGFVPNYITSGDIDGDGSTDLVASNLLDGTVSIYKNTSSINDFDASSFTTTTLTVAVGTYVTTVLLQDLDNDQKPELIVANNSNSIINFFPNTSSSGLISFGAMQQIDIRHAAPPQLNKAIAKKITVADMDADGKPDIITANSGEQFISIIRNTSTAGNFTFDTPYIYSVPSNPEAITTADLNRDGLPEIVVSMSQDGAIIIFQNRGALTSFFATNSLATNNIGHTAVKLADFNKDGLLDIAVANAGPNASNRSITIFENVYPVGAKGVQPPKFTKAGDYVVPGEISDVAIADFNGDGWPDMAASIKSTYSVVIYLNTLTASGTIDAASFTSSLSLPLGNTNTPNGLCVSDFDRNGKADIATVNIDGRISVLGRASQMIPGASMSLSTGDSQVTTCPATPTLMSLGLTGKSPWTIKYRLNNSIIYETITGITDAGYQFNVSPEESTRYDITYVKDAQQCDNYTIYSQNFVRINIIPTPVLKPNTIPNAAVGSAYNQTCTLEPAETPLSWAVSSGLPTGLSFADGVISGIPTIRNTYTFTVTAVFPVCSATKQYSLLISDNSTTWNGTTWSNGVPVNTKDAIIDGNYNTSVNGAFNCYHLVVNESDTLFITGKNNITVAGNAINNGVIHKDCSAELSISGILTGKTFKTIQPQILPAFLASGLINMAYEQPLGISIGESPVYTLTNSLPSGLTLTNGIIAGTPDKIGRYDFSIHSSEYNGLCEASGNFSIFIETADPNLKFPFNGITKTTGTEPFSYTCTSQSTGKIKYSITPAGACASVDELTGVVTITCGGPLKQYTITAIQEASFVFNADTATTILTIEKNKPELRFAKTGYRLGNTTGNTIQYQTNSTGTVSIFQINNNNVATVNIAGNVTPIAAGTFDILLKIAETPAFQALDTIVTIGVYSSYVPPQGASATVVLEVGQDSVINILNNAQGITGAIESSLTDIDVENTGIQYKFYSTELGNFVIDNSGNVTIRPFEGFIGEAKIGYILTDENGTTSDVYYIHVVVNPPYIIPDLKANDIITPNNDGLNDSFVIAFTDLARENSLTILDESGSMVYTANNYQNNWAGTTNKGDLLEPGVYFYAFNEKYSGRSLNGFIQIVK